MARVIDIKTRLGAIAVHRGQQNLARAAFGNQRGKGHRINTSGFASAVGEQLPFAGGYGFGIDGAYDALAAKLIGGLGHHIGVGHGGRIEADLVGSGQQHGARTSVDGTAAHRPPRSAGYSTAPRCGARHVDHRARGRPEVAVDVEEARVRPRPAAS